MVSCLKPNGSHCVKSVFFPSYSYANTNFADLDVRLSEIFCQFSYNFFGLLQNNLDNKINNNSRVSKNIAVLFYKNLAYNHNLTR